MRVYQCDKCKAVTSYPSKFQCNRKRRVIGGDEADGTDYDRTERIRLNFELCDECAAKIEAWIRFSDEPLPKCEVKEAG